MAQLEEKSVVDNHIQHNEFTVWDKQTKDMKLNINRDCVKYVGSYDFQWHNIFGHEIIDLSSVNNSIEFKIQIKQINGRNSMLIGIINNSNIKANQKLHVGQLKNSYGYCGNGSFGFDNKFKKYGEKYFNNDVISIIISSSNENKNQFTLSFAKNDKNMGVVCDAIPMGKYKLAVSMLCKNDEIRTLSC
eukprot:194586_1